MFMNPGGAHKQLQLISLRTKWAGRSS